MLKTRGLLLAVLLWFPAAILVGEPVLADYLDGTVEVRTGQGAWKPLSEGEVISSDDQVRLTKGVAELVAGSHRLHLVRAGVYRLSDLLTAHPANQGNWTALAGEKVDKLLGSGKAARVTVANAGVRGDSQAQAAPQWTDDEEVVTTLDDSVAAKAWPEALEKVNEAIATGDGESTTLWVTKATILQAMGRSAAALVALDKAALKPGQERYMQGILLTVTVGLELEDYTLVLDRTTEALALPLELDANQTLSLGRALAYRGLGDTVRYQSQLDATFRLGPATAVGTEAKRLGAQ